MGSAHLRPLSKSLTLKMSHCLELENYTCTINVIVKETSALWRKKVSKSNLLFHGGLKKNPKQMKKHNL